MSSLEPEIADAAIIGAGPIGLEVAIALKQAGLRAVQFDRGQIGQIIYNFPPHMRFFSSPERIAIGGIPIQSADQSKCTREEYLAHLRVVAMHHDLNVRTFEDVLSIARKGDLFELVTNSLAGTRRVRAESVVLATGGTARPRRLGIPGEDLPHVTHDLGDPHRYFRKRVVVVGGRNSAVEAALRCHHAGAHVAICHRQRAFSERVKYWLKPEIEMLIRAGRIDGHFLSKPIEITPTHITLEHLETGETVFLPTDFVLLMIGFDADMTLFERLGVTLEGPERKPVYDPETMETDAPGVYVAGTAIGGTQQRFTVYLENCHIHAQRIAAALIGAQPPTERMPYEVPET